MKTFVFDFAVQAWIKGLEIEAETCEEAEEELLSMSLEKNSRQGFCKRFRYFWYWMWNWRW